MPVFQPRVRGMQRLQLTGAAHPKVRAWVEREAARFGVSKSFVIATAVAHVANIDEQEDYHKYAPKPKRKRKRGKK